MTVKERLFYSNHILINDHEQPHDWKYFDFSNDKGFVCEYGKKLASNDTTITEADKIPQPTPDLFDPYADMELSLPWGSNHDRNVEH